MNYSLEQFEQADARADRPHNPAWARYGAVRRAMRQGDWLGRLVAVPGPGPAGLTSSDDGRAPDPADARAEGR